MKLLSRDDIRSADDLRAEVVDVPEWGGAVRVRMLSGAEADAFEAGRLDRQGKPDLDNFRAAMVAECVVDDEGRRLFTPADAEWLGRKGVAALDRVFQAASRLNGMGRRPDPFEQTTGNGSVTG